MIWLCSEGFHALLDISSCFCEFPVHVTGLALGFSLYSFSLAF